MLHGAPPQPRKLGVRNRQRLLRVCWAECGGVVVRGVVVLAAGGWCHRSTHTAHNALAAQQLTPHDDEPHERRRHDDEPDRHSERVQGQQLPGQLLWRASRAWRSHGGCGCGGCE